MKKLYVFLFAVCLGISTGSHAAQTIGERIRSFCKKNETRLAIIAAAVAGTGMGSYITYHLCNKKNQTVEDEYEDILLDLNMELEESRDETKKQKERFVEFLKADFERHVMAENGNGMHSPMSGDLITDIETTVEIFDDCFQIILTGDKEEFGHDSQAFEKNGFTELISKWPQWQYNRIEFIFKGHDGISYTIKQAYQKLEK